MTTNIAPNAVTKVEARDISPARPSRQPIDPARGVSEQRYLLSR
jgi:hypothetical protein